jgi:hypothetical protein
MKSLRNDKLSELELAVYGCGYQRFLKKNLLKTIIDDVFGNRYANQGLHNDGDAWEKILHSVF